MNQNINLYNVNGSVVLTGKIAKRNQRLVDKPINFYMRPLNVKDAHAMMNLSACIYEHLGAGQECFIHKHDKKYYKQVFENQNITYIGVFVGKNLIAMSYFLDVKNATELQQELPNHNLDFGKTSRLEKVMMQNAKIASLGADSVLPEFRGNNLNYYMIKYRVALAKELHFTDCVSIIDRKNIWNMTPYFGNSFSMFSGTIDPADNGKIALMHRPLLDRVVFSKQLLEGVDFKDLGQIDNLLNNGYAGIEFEKSSNQVIFAKTDYYQNLKTRRYERTENIFSNKGRRIVEKVRI